MGALAGFLGLFFAGMSKSVREEQKQWRAEQDEAKLVEKISKTYGRTNTSIKVRTGNVEAGSIAPSLFLTQANVAGAAGQLPASIASVKQWVVDYTTALKAFFPFLAKEAPLFHVTLKHAGGDKNARARLIVDFAKRVRAMDPLFKHPPKFRGPLTAIEYRGAHHVPTFVASKVNTVENVPALTAAQIPIMAQVVIEGSKLVTDLAENEELLGEKSFNVYYDFAKGTGEPPIDEEEFSDAVDRDAAYLFGTVFYDKEFRKSYIWPLAQLGDITKHAVIAAGRWIDASTVK